MLDCDIFVEESVAQTGADVQTVTSTLSLVQIWDLISGTNDTRPYDQHFRAAAVAALEERCGGGPLRILDLGGGAGNPSIGLAEYGHSIDLVDNDPDMCVAAIERSRHLESGIRVVRQDWREYLAGARLANAKYDAILFFGNALAYQDSWPDQPLPIAHPLDLLVPTLKSCREILAPSGCLFIEAGLEPAAREASSYLRVAETPQSIETTSVWRVDCDPGTHSRSIDTLIVRRPVAARSPVLGRVAFQGWLLTKEELLDAARLGDLDAEHEHTQFRDLFTAVVLRRRD
jgi:SAM-dependent methyltransferase